MAELHDARRLYGRRLALQIQSLSIHENECIAFSGMNGAGKSTILKAIFGMAPIESGKVIWEGRPKVDSSGEVQEMPVKRFLASFGVIPFV